ncbi:UNVERIFIED_CONTAM: hypothetical protein GTU68_057753, partial [Idotea baltica]|nr:hypothetical protein [Idotea baltica]
MVLGKEKLVDKCRLGHAGDTKSDHLMLANVFRKWQDTRGGETNRFVWDNFLSSSILMQLKNMRAQFTDILNDRKFIATRNPDARSVNRNSDNVSLVKAVITAGLYPNVARVLK